VRLAQLIESCGVTAIAVHGRTREERPNNGNHDDVIAAVAAAVGIPVIAKSVLWFFCSREEFLLVN